MKQYNVCMFFFLEYNFLHYHCECFGAKHLVKAAVLSVLLPFIYSFCVVVSYILIMSVSIRRKELRKQCKHNGHYTISLACRDHDVISLQVSFGNNTHSSTNANLDRIDIVVNGNF